MYEVPYQTTLGQTTACIAKLSHVDERENRACCSSISSDLGAFWVISYSIKVSGHI